MDVIGRITGAAFRALLVALVIATPALMLSGSGSNAPEIIVFIACLAALFVFAEYNTVFPSILEFRDAPPLNRMKFLAFGLTVFFLTMMTKDVVFPTETTRLFANLGATVGHGLDFPYSPVRLLVLIVPQNAPPELSHDLRAAAGMAYAICMIFVLAFLVIVRVTNWPTTHGAFNVWTNLPLFDPTAGGDVVARLYSDARMNTIMGILLPFIIPALIKVASSVGTPLALLDPHLLIWLVTAWAIFPAAMIMRGIAMSRIAGLIEEKRRRAYAVAEAEAETGGVQVA
jgi:hypothetical protein